VAGKVWKKKCDRKIAAQKVWQKNHDRKIAAEKVRQKNHGRKSMLVSIYERYGTSSLRYVL
jgi:hypothetical protein